MPTCWILISIVSDSFLFGMGTGYQGNMERRWRVYVFCMEKTAFSLPPRAARRAGAETKKKRQKAGAIGSHLLPFRLANGIRRQPRRAGGSAGKMTSARTPSFVFSRIHAAPWRSRIARTRYSPRPLPPLARFRDPSAR